MISGGIIAAYMLQLVPDLNLTRSLFCLGNRVLEMSGNKNQPIKTPNLWSSFKEETEIEINLKKIYYIYYILGLFCYYKCQIEDQQHSNISEYYKYIM